MYIAEREKKLAKNGSRYANFISKKAKNQKNLVIIFKKIE